MKRRRHLNDSKKHKGRDGNRTALHQQDGEFLLDGADRVSSADRFSSTDLAARIKSRPIDVSRYGLEHAPESIRGDLCRQRAEEPYPWGDKHFDLVISLATLHNLRLFELKTALQEVERVGKEKYVMVESYRNEQELFNLECWALTARAFFDTAEWIWIFQLFGYTGDYEFIYFE